MRASGFEPLAFSVSGKRSNRAELSAQNCAMNWTMMADLNHKPQSYQHPEPPCQGGLTPIQASASPVSDSSGVASSGRILPELADDGRRDRVTAEAFSFGCYLAEELAAREWSINEFVKRIGYANPDEYGIWYLTVEFTIAVHERSCRVGPESATAFARALGIQEQFILAIERAFIDSGLECSCAQCAEPNPDDDGRRAERAA